MHDPLSQPGEARPPDAAPADRIIAADQTVADAVPKPDADGGADGGDDVSAHPAEPSAPASADAQDIASEIASEVAADTGGAASDAGGTASSRDMHENVAEPEVLASAAGNAEAVDTAVGTAGDPAVDPEVDPEVDPADEVPTDTTDAGASAQVPAPAMAELSPAACAARLADLFPALFKGAPKPLKLRIQADIQQRAPGVFSKKSLSTFLHRHTTTNAYLVALSQTAQRVDLDGAPAGDLSDEHRQAAVTELARRRSLHDGRRAAEQAARREAEQAARRAAELQARQERQERAVEDDARRDRTLLLRAFETSTLTRANFCALKRITEAELDALLASARQEAAQRTQTGWQERPQERQGPNDRPGERPNERRPDGRRDPRPPDDRGPGGPGGQGPRPAQRAGPRRPAAPPKAQR